MCWFTYKIIWMYLQGLSLIGSDIITLQIKVKSVRKRPGSVWVFPVCPVCRVPSGQPAWTPRRYSRSSPPRHTPSDQRRSSASGRPYSWSTNSWWVWCHYGRWWRYVCKQVWCYLSSTSTHRRPSEPRAAASCRAVFCILTTNTFTISSV